MGKLTDRQLVVSNNNHVVVFYFVFYFFNFVWGEGGSVVYVLVLVNVITPSRVVLNNKNYKSQMNCLLKGVSFCFQILSYIILSQYNTS